jgi:hypothetical protein
MSELRSLAANNQIVASHDTGVFTNLCDGATIGETLWRALKG